MRNLAARIERLEEVYNPAEIVVIMITNFGNGEIKGWQGNGFYIARNPGETEEECADRAYQESKAYGEARPSLPLPGGVLLIHMDRERIRYVKPEPVPDPSATAHLPKSRVVTKPSRASAPHPGS